MIDGTDASIVSILQSNARTSNAEIARQVGLAPSAVFERIRKLEERGVLEGYAARLNPKAVGLPNAYLDRDIPRRALYARMWEEVKAS